VFTWKSLRCKEKSVYPSYFLSSGFGAVLGLVGAPLLELEQIGVAYLHIVDVVFTPFKAVESVLGYWLSLGFSPRNRVS
jgi:hypothetical protein